LGVFAFCDKNKGKDKEKNFLFVCTSSCTMKI